MKRIFLQILIWLCSLSGSALPQHIESEIIQIRMDRIYFSDGSEAGVGADFPFVIECEGQPPLEGIIEYVGPGISFSRPIAELGNISINPDCIARLTVAAVDSSAEIIIGTGIPLDMFDPEHETLMIRDRDTLIRNLVDSILVIGNMVDIFIHPDILFSDRTLLDSESLAWWFRALRENSRSYLTRYFFSKLATTDSIGIETITDNSLRLRFRHPFPRSVYFLSHPDFAVFNKKGKGTGKLVQDLDPAGNPEEVIYVPNPHGRGDKVAFSKLVVRFFEQSYLMKYAYEQGSLDGYIGFGFEDELAGVYETKAFYPNVAAMIAGIAGQYFLNGMLATSLYYRFDPSKAHLYFPEGQIKEANRWLIRSDLLNAEQRFYPFSFLDGKRLHAGISVDDMKLKLVYDHPLLFKTAGYLADIAAREGTTSTLESYSFGEPFDIRLAFLPASDEIMPFSLFAAVLELNDQNSFLPPQDQLDRPAWPECDLGSRLFEIPNRNNNFFRAEGIVFEEGAFFPLYRPYLFALLHDNVSGLDFDFYGFPVLEKTVKFLRTSDASPEGESR